MHAETTDRLKATLGHGPDWFWEWVEINQQDDMALPDWFRQASPEDLLVFWRMYFETVLGALVPPSEGIEADSDEGDFQLSEHHIADINNWVIVQGKAVWEAMAQLARLRASSDVKYNPQALEAIFHIYQNTKTAASEGRTPDKANWLGLSWIPRDGFFPGDMADFIYEERFGETLWEQM